MNRALCRQLRAAGAGLVPLVILCFILPGCASTFRAVSSRSVDCSPASVFARADTQSYNRSRLGVFQFNAPFYAAATSPELTTIYWQELIRSGVFKQVVVIEHNVDSVSQAIWWGQHERCDLIMLPELVYTLDGSGALTNRIEVNVKLIDTRSGRLLWYFAQTASSRPGPDLDFGWTTIAGKPAKSYRYLARTLAWQAAQLLLPPPPTTQQYCCLQPATATRSSAAITTASSKSSTIR